MFMVAKSSRGYGRDRYTRTQQRTAVAARILLALNSADFPRNITSISFVHQRLLSAPQSSSAFPIFDGRLQAAKSTRA